MLTGKNVTLRPATEADVPALVAIRSEPGVHRWWRGADDLEGEVRGDLTDDELDLYVIVYDGTVIGAIQSTEENEPDYRHASIDIYVSDRVRGCGLGGDAIATLAHHLVTERGHHRVSIDPAADNTSAIRCYTKVGFRPVGVMRRYERGLDGTFHDGLLMDLLAEELIHP
jgi:aminoglycoside 6'-N-acetyltransferase